jgi:hypothetical protein
MMMMMMMMMMNENNNNYYYYIYKLLIHTHTHTPKTPHTPFSYIHTHTHTQNPKHHTHPCPVLFMIGESVKLGTRGYIWRKSEKRKMSQSGRKGDDGSSQDGDESKNAFCRYCFDDGEEEKLIAPCLCCVRRFIYFRDVFNKRLRRTTYYYRVIRNMYISRV